MLRDDEMDALLAAATKDAGIERLGLDTYPHEIKTIAETLGRLDGLTDDQTTAVIWVSFFSAVLILIADGIGSPQAVAEAALHILVGEGDTIDDIIRMADD